MGWKNSEEKKRYQAAWYLRNKERTKEARAAWGKANRHLTREYVKAWEKRHPRRYMLQRARMTARPRGLEFSITVEDLMWPTHCPIFGIELCYDRDKKTPRRDDYPTLDRWDNSKGYVPGNVFVISWLANRMKWNASVDQLKALVRYMEEKPLTLS